MQRFLFFKLATSNLSKNITNNTNSSLLFSQPCKTFTSLTRLTHQYQNHMFGTSLIKNPIQHFHSCQSHHIYSGKIHGFLSNPLLLKRFLSNLSNAHFRVSTKSLTNCKVGFLRARFARGYSSFNTSFGSYWRGWRSWLHRLTPNDVVFGLIVANVAVFLLWRIADQRFMIQNFMISLDNFKSGRVHTLITSAFSHIDAEHIISNMIGLYFFGTNIARNFGPEYLLKLYLAGAIGGSVFYLLHHALMGLLSKGRGMWARDPSRTPGLVLFVCAGDGPRAAMETFLVGASGAVNAIMLLDIFLNPRATLYFDFIIPVPAILLGIFLIGKDILRIIEGNSNISGSAHLGGAAVAAIAWARFKKGRF